MADCWAKLKGEENGKMGEGRIARWQSKDGLEIARKEGKIDKMTGCWLLSSGLCCEACKSRLSGRIELILVAF